VLKHFGSADKAQQELQLESMIAPLQVLGFLPSLLDLFVNPQYEWLLKPGF
jgi:hypothetical protein